MEEEENLLRQQEEIEVLNSIYEENLVLGQDKLWILDSAYTCQDTNVG